MEAEIGSSRLFSYAERWEVRDPQSVLKSDLQCMPPREKEGKKKPPPLSPRGPNPCLSSLRSLLHLCRIVLLRSAEVRLVCSRFRGVGFRLLINDPSTLKKRPLY